MFMMAVYSSSRAHHLIDTKLHDYYTDYLKPNHIAKDLKQYSIDKISNLEIVVSFNRQSLRSNFLFKRRKD